MRNGSPRSVVYADTGASVATDYFQHYDTVEKLFDAIQDAIKRDADEVTVTYDPALGYPSNISIDFEEMAIDDEITFVVSAFERTR